MFTAKHFSTFQFKKNILKRDYCGNALFLCTGTTVHTLRSLVGTISGVSGVDYSGAFDILLAAGVIAKGSVEHVLEGKHYKRSIMY